MRFSRILPELRVIQDFCRRSCIIRKKRFSNGMLSLSLPESEIVFDDEGQVIDAIPEDDAYTHTIIEMFMVAGNEAVAWLFAGLETPLLRRIHPDPDLTQ